LFFVSPDGCSQLADSCAQVLDLGRKAGKGVCFSDAAAVFFDDRAQVSVAVEGRPAQAGSGCNVVEGDWLAGQDQLGTCVLHEVPALFGGSHPACACWM
jgi:hypothetical protein